MKLHFLSVSPICLLLSVPLGCSNGGTTKSQPDPNVLIYSSFEENGRPSLAGWFPDDTSSHIQFSRDVPPGGGRWSLSIRNTLRPQDMTVARTAPALPGTTDYGLSFWAKTKGEPGKAILGGKTGETWVARAIRLAADSTWLAYFASLTVDGDTGDSIFVGVSGSSTSQTGTTYFDLVKLEKLD